jgi:glycosyltransferase involved in cell wall biosynthesis
LVCPAAFVEKKGHAILLEAFRSLLDHSSAMELHLFGEGPLRNQIVDQVRQLSLGDAVRFHGFVPLDQLRAFMIANRPICVLASHLGADGQDEGIPVTLIEAMACGAPVVATRTGAIEHLVSGDAGRLVPPADPVALECAIREVAGDVAASADRCRTAYERVREEFDLSRTTGRMIDLMRSADTDGVEDPREFV